MSKAEAFEYLSGLYPSMRLSHYKGREGTRVLWAIYYKVIRRSNGR